MQVKIKEQTEGAEWREQKTGLQTFTRSTEISAAI